ncbi:MAG TPA: radical SAM protein [Spirochaetota bacterium]|nr:radical SAM protein [Spirochaetota bacterium]HOQ11819.1 radical SAM protein [Spirochaetota bacterium]
MNCNLCNFKCNVDRRYKKGACGLDDSVYVAHYGLHRGEEPFLTGKKGSGTIFFAGCTLKCIFCQNYQISRWNLNNRCIHVKKLTSNGLSEIFWQLKNMGAANINLVSPTPYVYSIIEATKIARSDGFDLPFVYNTHGYDSIKTVEMLNGIVDIYLPDLKYGDDSLGEKFSKAKGIYSQGKNTIKAMYEQVGLLKTDSDNLATKGIAVRHLVIPGHIESSFEVLDFLETLDRKIHISLMSQFHPCDLSLRDKYPELKRTLQEQEYQRVVDYAWALGFKNLLIQDMESHRHYLPDFNREKVFED